MHSFTTGKRLGSILIKTEDTHDEVLDKLGSTERNIDRHVYY